MEFKYQIASVEHMFNQKLQKVRGGGGKVSGILNISEDMHREPELKWYTGCALSCRSISVGTFIFMEQPLSHHRMKIA